ncbi:MAG: S8 family serine peptidase [Bacteroidota bacterium]
MKLLNVLCFMFLSFPLLSQDVNRYAKDQLVFQFSANYQVDAETAIKQMTFGYRSLDLLNAQLGLASIQLTGNRHTKNTFVLTYATPMDIPALVDAYKQLTFFEFVEPNFIGTTTGKQGFLPILPNDAFFGRQYALVNDGSFFLGNVTADADIDMEDAWDIEQGSSDIIVAVLDNGCKIDHPEFAGRIWTNPGEVNSGSDTDNNGYADDINGWDFAYDDNDPDDAYGHGTNVTGILAATGNNGIGYAGVDWNCQIMPIKIINDDDFGFFTWWAEGIYYAVDNGADVINMSVVGYDFSSNLNAAVNYARNNGVLIVASAGNDDTSSPGYPAGYTNAMAIASSDPDDERTDPFFWDNSSGSNFGDYIDIIAPGNFMYGLSYNSNTNYNSYWGGTSQASPLVAGVAALLLAQNPGRSPDDLVQILTSTAEDQVGRPTEDTPGYDIYHGHGRLNAFQALSQIATSVDDPSISAPAIRLFPNPATDQVQFELPEAGVRELVIRDAVGQLMDRVYVIPGSNLVELSLDGWTSGAYFVSAVLVDGSIQRAEHLVVTR